MEVSVGDFWFLDFLVTGSAPYTFQWFKDGSPIFTQTRVVGSNSFTTFAAYSDFGSYYCVVNNSVNTIQSREATVTGLSYTKLWLLLCVYVCEIWSYSRVLYIYI